MFYHFSMIKKMNFVLFFLFVLSTLHIVECIASCFPNPCHNNAQCLTFNGSSSCQCSQEFVGEYCQYPNPCYPHSQCQNGGACSVQITESRGVEFLCSCPVGYSASLCEISLPNACDQDPCLNHGTCHLISLTEFECLCPSAFEGKFCEKPDFCASGPCRNGATCISTTSGYKCICPEGFRGSNCVEDIDECTEANPCVHGKCVNVHGGYQCHCSQRYTGKNCDALFVPCEPNPCHNNGLCIPYGNTKHHCQCPTGFSGRNCEINIDDCVGNRCANGGRCVDGINNYACECPANYKGAFCTEDVDECSLLPHLCQNLGTCMNTVGGFKCVCVNGWEGQFCQINKDDCVGNVCFNGGTCHDRIGNFYCECPVGKTGLLCHLDDACVSNPCQGSGAICSTNPVDGSYHCSCPKGFYGKDCSIDKDECAEGNPCEHGGTCVNTPGSYRCLCPSGWTGKWCMENINECASNPCRNGATCLDDIGRFICVCMPGFTGLTCDIDVNECSVKKQPCLNGGTCHDLINGYNCSCPTGYAGRDCSLKLEHACMSNPCKGKDATCSINPLDGSPVCTCLPGFWGADCSLDKDECTDKVCENGGTCVNTVGSYYCMCKPGYTGKHCASNINECFPVNPCHNGGTCWDLVNEARCICKPGFIGPTCEVEVDECSLLNNPCKNGAVCVPTANHGYNCTCAIGFIGSHCEINADDCSPNPCINGGTCEDMINGFRCHCPIGSFGVRCESFINGSKAANSSNPAPCKCELDKTTQREKQLCEQRNCEAKRNDGVCNMECNFFACHWDGSDCSAGRDPYRACPDASLCARVHGDNNCDSRCYTEACLWDGGDCDMKPGLCNPLFAGYCERHYADGSCDSGCNNAGCNFDGGDCLPGKERKKEMLTGELVLIVLIDPPTFRNRSTQFLMSASKLSGVSFRIKTDDSGNQMIYPWNSDTGIDLTESITGLQKPVFLPKRRGTDNVANGAAYSGTLVVLEVDISHCVIEGRKSCFTEVSKVADFLGAEVANQKLEKAVSMPIYSISASRDDDDNQPETAAKTNALTTGLIAFVAAVALIFLIIVVLYRKRKIQAPLWMPDGWTGQVPVKTLERQFASKANHYEDSLKSTPSIRRRNPDGSESLEKHLGQLLDLDDVGKLNHHRGMVAPTNRCDGRQWSDADTCYSSTTDIYAAGSTLPLHYRTGDCSLPGQLANCHAPFAAKRFRTIDSGYGGLVDQGSSQGSASPDCCEQNSDLVAGLHTEGYGTWTQQHFDAAKGALDSLPSNANAKGPDGVTPVMVAARQGDTRVLDTLFNKGAEANAVMASTKDTALHLAVQCARPRAVQKLIQSGADVNLLNMHGVAPLHLAVGTFNTEIVKVLLASSNIDVDIKSQTLSAVDKLPEEATPLIYASKYSKGDSEILELLLNAHACVAATDKDGKTALHWAAYCDNCSAIEMLIARGANKDAQDVKDQTPLFLAAVEGNYNAVGTLLRLGASKDITDKEDRQARDVAECGHFRHIVELLERNISLSSTTMSRSENPSQAYSGKLEAEMANQQGKPNSGQKPKPPRRTKSLREAKPSGTTSLVSDGAATMGRRKAPVAANRQKRCSEREQAAGYQSSGNGRESSQNITATPSPGNNLYQGQILGVHQGPYSDMLYSSGQSSNGSPPVMGGYMIMSPPESYKSPPPGGAMSKYGQSPPNYGQSPPQYFSDPHGSPSQTASGVHQWDVSGRNQAYYGNQQLSPSVHNVLSPNCPSSAGLPTSPVHMVAMQHAQQKRLAHTINDICPSQSNSNYEGLDNVYQTGLMDNYYSSSQVPYNNTNEKTTQPNSQTTGYCSSRLRDIYPTPSPESPGQWGSNSSPCSANAEWCDQMSSVSSPPNSVIQTQPRQTTYGSSYPQQHPMTLSNSQQHMNMLQQMQLQQSECLVGSGGYTNI